MNRVRRGAALLEVLVAIVIVATAGVALLRLAQESSATTRTLASREEEVLRASELLREAVVTIRSGAWPSDLRVGRDGLTVQATATVPGVWRLSVTAVDTHREVLATMVRGPR